MIEGLPNFIIGQCHTGSTVNVFKINNPSFRKKRIKWYYQVKGLTWLNHVYI